MKKKPIILNDPKTLREKLGLSLVALAAKARISRSTILRAEKSGRFSGIPLIAEAHRRALGIA